MTESNLPEVDLDLEFKRAWTSISDGAKVNLHLIYKSILFHSIMSQHGQSGVDACVAMVNQIAKDLDTSAFQKAASEVNDDQS